MVNFIKNSPWYSAFSTMFVKWCWQKSNFGL
jgi:hypothetical protein